MKHLIETILIVSMIVLLPVFDSPMEEKNPSCSDKLVRIVGGNPEAGFGCLYFDQIPNMIEKCKNENTAFYIDLKIINNRKYYDPALGENTWNYWFEPVDNQDSITLCENSEKKEYFSNNTELYNWYFRSSTFKMYYYMWGETEHKDRSAYDEEWYRTQRKRRHVILKDYVHIKKDIQEEIDRKWDLMFQKDDFVLGIHMRGTDKGFGRRKVFPEEYFSYIKQFLRYFPNGKIFVATDDAKYFETLKKEGIQFESQEVIRSSNRTAVFDLDVPKYQIGTEILNDIVLLSKCDWIIHSASSVADAAISLNFDLHEKSVHLEYTKNRQVPFWFKQEE